MTLRIFASDRRWALRPAFLAVFVVCFTSACTTPMKTSPITEYSNALRALDQSPAPSPEANKAGIAAFEKFYASLTTGSVRDLTSKTYARELFFNDSLKTIRTASELEHYFLETAKNTERVTATVTDVAISGSNVYVRWEMEIEFKKFQRGEVHHSIGMTHLRFDEEGRIVLHQDYWDAASGFYEHVPILGSAIRWIKSMF